MTTICNISAGFLQTYMTYNGKTNLNPKDIFKRLSLEMGGDGEKITKKQLDDYIDKAESGTIDIDKTKLSALKRIQEDWNTISGGKDSITYSDMENYSALLLETVAGSFTKTEIDDSKSSINDAIYDYLTDYLGLSSKDNISKSDLTSYLGDLISNSSNNDDSNSELIGALTNLIATHSSNSTIEAEA